MATDTEDHIPAITFGIVSDVQYADVEDGTDFSKTKQRYYRNSISLLKNAINDWKRSVHPVSFVLQLGDLIDGKNKREGEGISKKALTVALHPFNSLHIPVYHVIGNHELYNMTRSFYLNSPLNSSLSLSIETTAKNLYYTFLPHPKLRIVNLDSYEISLLGYDDNVEDENYKTALEWFHAHNFHEDVNDSTDLEGLDKRWAGYNGGISQKQLQWLAQVLEKAQSKEENVIITSHTGLQSQVKNAICLVWNYEEVLDVVHRFDCVVAVLAGHDHDGFDCIDNNSLQHITFSAIVETRPGQNCYATAHLWKNQLEVIGVGRIPSYTVPLRFPTS